MNTLKTIHSFNTTATINILSSSPFIYYYIDENTVEVYNITTNQLFMVDMDEENYFIWNND